MKLYFITGNKNKFQEVKAFVPKVEQLDLELTEIQEIDAQKIISAKLDEAFKHNKGQFIVEDTSLYLDCLNGLPGPLIKWFLKTVGNDGLAEIATKLRNNRATAISLVGYAGNKRDIHFFEGKVAGTIVKPRGTNGFGWDMIFQPKGSIKTFAEMTTEEKNGVKMNMRKLAIKQLKSYLTQKS